MAAVLWRGEVVLRAEFYVMTGVAFFRIDVTPLSLSQC